MQNQMEFIIKLFLEVSKQENLGLILSMFCVVIEDESSLK